MKRPNISTTEFQDYVGAAGVALQKSMNDYVLKKRLPQSEADNHLSKYTPLISAMQSQFSAGIPKEGPPVMTLAIRGYYQDSLGKPGENDRGIYDDAMVLMGFGYFNTFNGNTDPRKYGNGIGMLLPGLYEFKQGYHGYGKPSGHFAFRTNNATEELPVLRDGQFGIKKGKTVNHHKGGKNDVNSIACQTVQSDQWATEYKPQAYRLTEKMGKILQYLLIEQKWFQ